MNNDFSTSGKSAFTALALNFFLPGAGYAYAGMYVFAVLLFMIFVLAVKVYLPVAVLLWLFGIVDGPLAVNRRYAGINESSMR